LTHEPRNRAVTAIAGAKTRWNLIDLLRPDARVESSDHGGRARVHGGR
jgi:hypothetical protein